MTKKDNINFPQEELCLVKWTQSQKIFANVKIPNLGILSTLVALEWLKKMDGM